MRSLTVVPGYNGVLAILCIWIRLRQFSKSFWLRSPIKQSSQLASCRARRNCSIVKNWAMFIAEPYLEPTAASNFVTDECNNAFKVAVQCLLRMI